MAVLCPELPRARGEVTDASRSFPPLADRMAQESGFRVVVGMLRGAGGSEGDFSASGWLEDLGFLVGREAGDDPVWLVGFGLGGALALPQGGGRSPRSGASRRWVPPPTSGPGRRPTPWSARCRARRAISAGYPPDEAAWMADLVALDPVAAAAALGDRPLLVMHGTEDDEVPVADARALAEAASGPVDLKVVIGAGPLAARRPPGGGHAHRLGGTPAIGTPAASDSLERARRSPGARARRVPGSVASQSQRTTTKCRTPASTSSGTRSGETPPVTKTGTAARETAWAA